MNNIEERLQKVEQDITLIQERNKKVEADKAWEISLLRKVSIALFTYIVIALFMWFTDITNPWLNAVVPTVAFFLSTLSISLLKQWWLKNNSK